MAIGMATTLVLVVEVWQGTRQGQQGQEICLAGRLLPLSLINHEPRNAILIFTLSDILL
jgi:hypothetical protein